MVEMNKNYWQERQHKREAKAYSKILDVEKEYKEALERAKININKQISHIGTTYMKDNQLSYAEAMKQLKGAEYKVWRKELHEYMQEWKKLEKEAPLEAKKLWLEIETLSARSRISHLDTIRAQIDIELSKVSTEAVESTRKALYGVYGDTYKEVVGDLGVKSMFSNEIAKAVIDRPWSGANYSNRIWGNSEKLARALKQEVTTGMIQGINLKKMGKRISDRIEGAKKNDVERLLRTEVNYTMNQATLDGYKDAKVEKYEFDATLDSRTSQICAELNGEVFEVNKTAVGVNYPPMHPRCRSTTSPIIDYEVLGKRLREEKDLQEKEKESTITFKEATDIKEAEKFIKQELGLDLSDYSKFNLETANMVNREIANIYNVFGDVGKAGYLNGVRAIPANRAGDAVGYYSSASKVVFMKKVASKKAFLQMKADAEEAYKYGFWSSKAMEHPIRHELGHAVQHWLTDNDSTKLSKIEKLREKVMRECNIDTWEQKASKEVMKKAGEQLSYYGLYTSGEFIAESVAEYLTGNPRNIAKKVVDILLERE